MTLQVATDLAQTVTLFVLIAGIARAHRRISEMRRWIAENYPEKK